MRSSPLFFYPETLGFKAGFSSKRGEDSSEFGLNLGLNTSQDSRSVLKNREHFSRLLEKNELVFAHQVHGTEILEVTHSGIFDDVDGLITRKKNLVLNILTADCLGILACDPEAGIAGAFHAGWKGSAGKITLKGLNQMISLGASPEKISVFMNPGICGKCYEVGPELKNFFESSVFHQKNGKLYLDLVLENKKQILSAGIPEHRITIDLTCTFENPDLYSFRKDKEKAGRFASFIVMEP